MANAICKLFLCFMGNEPGSNQRWTVASMTRWYRPHSMVSIDTNVQSAHEDHPALMAHQAQRREIGMDKLLSSGTGRRVPMS